MSSQISFPTQGELLKFVFQSTGILANRHNQTDLTQNEIERIQTQLRRLAKEDGDFLKNFEDCQFLLREKFLAILQDDYWVTAIGQGLLDLFQCYLETIHREGTFRNKKTNLAYLVELVWMPRLAMSIFKYKWYFHQHFKKFKSPNVPFWFLGQDQQTPLALVIDWIYHVTGHTTTSFHASSKYEIEQRDLENVRHWRQGKHLPTWHDVQQTFQRAMQQQQIAPDQQRLFQRYLFLARWATAILEQLQQHYGQYFNQKLIASFQHQLHLLDQAFVPIHQNRPPKLEHLLQQKAEGFNLEQNQEMYDQIAVDLFFKYLEPCWQEAATLQQQSPQQFKDIFHNLAQFNLKPLHQYCIISITHVLTTTPKYQALDMEHPAIENMLQGYNIITGKQKYHDKWLQQHEQYQSHIMFPWLKYWVAGRQALLQQQFQKAHQQLRQGFSIIKYSACRQHCFIEDYLTACAKINKRQDFNKALSWARYMDHFGQWQGKIPLDRNDEILFKQYQHAFIHQSGISFSYHPNEFP